MDNFVFIFLFIPPLLYAVGNILDKKLVQVGGESSPLLIITNSSLLAVFVLPIIRLFYQIQSVELIDLVFILISGMLTALSVFLYLKAIEGESIFSVAPALQLTPGVSYIIGLLFFNESVSVLGIAGCLLIIIGSIFLTIMTENNYGRKFNINIFIITSFSAISLAISGALFKFFAVKYDYWTIQYYEYFGLLVLGLVLISIFPNNRRRLFEILKFKRKGRNFVTLNLLTEGIMVIGDFALNFAVLVAPLLIAYSLNSLQPLFLLILGFIINRYTSIFGDKFNIGYFKLSTVAYVFIITLGAVFVTLSLKY